MPRYLAVLAYGKPENLTGL